MTDDGGKTFGCLLALVLFGGVAWALLARAQPGPYQPPQTCDVELLRRVVDDAVARTRYLMSSGPDASIETCSQAHAGDSFLCAFTRDGEWRWVQTR